MTDELLDIRMPLAASDEVHVELGRDGRLHVVHPTAHRQERVARKPSRAE